MVYIRGSSLTEKLLATCRVIFHIINYTHYEMHHGTSMSYMCIAWCVLHGHGISYGFPNGISEPRLDSTESAMEISHDNCMACTVVSPWDNPSVFHGPLHAVD